MRIASVSISHNAIVDVRLRPRQRLRRQEMIFLVEFIGNYHSEQRKILSQRSRR